MHLIFLGTSAANAYPEPFCACEHCHQARALGGRSLRKRSAMLINHDLLIDLGPDILASANQHRISLTQVRFCLQTHAHADHLDLSHLQSRSPAFGVVGTPVLDFFASETTLHQADAIYRTFLAHEPLLTPATETALRVRFHAVEPMHPFKAGPYRIIPFPTNHAPGALLFAIEDGVHTLFYATDSTSWEEAIWEGFHRFALQFDVVILDHTYGPNQPPGEDHLSANHVISYAHRLAEEGRLRDGAHILATHIAHEGNPPHPQLVTFAAQHGYEIAFDGLQISL